MSTLHILLYSTLCETFCTGAFSNRRSSNECITSCTVSSFNTTFFYPWQYRPLLPRLAPFPFAFLSLLLRSSFTPLIFMALWLFLRVSVYIFSVASFPFPYTTTLFHSSLPTVAPPSAFDSRAHSSLGYSYITRSPFFSCFFFAATEAYSRLVLRSVFRLIACREQAGPASLFSSSAFFVVLFCQRESRCSILRMLGRLTACRQPACSRNYRQDQQKQLWPVLPTNQPASGKVGGAEFNLNLYFLTPRRVPGPQSLQGCCSAKAVGVRTQTRLRRNH